MSTPVVIIYGAGDPGTKELIALAKRKKVEIVFKDIRDVDVNFTRTNLKEIASLTIGQTVPVVVLPNKTIVQDFEKARSWLVAQPNKSHPPAANVG